MESPIFMDWKHDLWACFGTICADSPYCFNDKITISLLPNGEAG